MSIEAVEQVASELAPEPPTEIISTGARLKAAREHAGLSIGDVAQRLKYSARQIHALEEGQGDVLPSFTFQRGFVRGYAKLLGLDGNALVATLESQVSGDSGPNTLQLQQVAYTPSTMPATANNSAAWPWLLATLLAVVGIGGYILSEWQAPSRTKHAISLPQTAVNANVTEPTATVPAAIEPSVGERLIPLPLPLAEIIAPPPTALGGKLRLVFAGESWTEVRQANGEVVYSGVGFQGMERWADGQPPFDLVIGNAKLVKLFYRGAEVDLTPYIKVSVARLQLK